MLTTDEAKKALRKWINKERVVDLKSLFQILETRSRMSVYRRLKEVGYLSSFTHRGAYYTLDDIPVFDEHGLWFFEGIGFSRVGSLKETIAHDVGVSEAGRIHLELEQLLHVRVHNTLLLLVRAGRVGREAFEGSHLYVSPDPACAANQFACRLERSALARADRVVLSDEVIIEVLVETLRASPPEVTAPLVADRLAGRGIRVEPDQVEEVFRRYEVRVAKKRAARRPPPSRD